MNTTATISRQSVNAHSFVYTYTRDTNFSFRLDIVRGDGKEFSRKIEKGMPEYGNTVSLFAQHDVALERGNSVIIEEAASLNA